MDFGEGFLPLVFAKPIINYKTAVSVLLLLLLI